MRAVWYNAGAYSYTFGITLIDARLECPP